MPDSKPRFVGVELCFEDLEAGKRFYRDILGLEVSDEDPGHHVRFGFGPARFYIERKGEEPGASAAEVGVFLEVSDLQATIDSIGRDRILYIESTGEGQRPPWAVLHDPEGHNVVLVQSVAARLQ